ncbi:dephospho-CoA kinase [Aliikangiella sp. G2MR2-5]|uniref:dephospho-CoA kinase n=1 Tax=Aliikangiella sp. G2MR2-5 TaxID=2788943 RepID=UPI0018AAA9DF|nr:dephospho-CoA kinase [Aliikangiella sp. G2MR2-5]
MLPLKIGLTGGIASGKSKVCSLFSSYGIDVIDADKIARELFRDGSPLLQDLREKFGDEIFTERGVLDRRKLRNIVFSDKDALQWLNNFTHPKVAQEMHKQFESSNSAYVVFDIPLLINKVGRVPSHLKPFIDRVLVIDIDESRQIERLVERDKISVEQAKKVLLNQSTTKQKLALADDIIDNNSDISALSTQVEKLHQRYLNLAQTIKN